SCLTHTSGGTGARRGCSHLGDRLSGEEGCEAPKPGHSLRAAQEASHAAYAHCQASTRQRFAHIAQYALPAGLRLGQAKLVRHARSELPVGGLIAGYEVMVEGVAPASADQGADALDH